MANSLAYLPPASPTNKLVIQVPTVSPIDEDFTLSPTLATLGSILPLLPDSTTVLLSSTPKETVDLALLSYTIRDSHVIHFFDHWGSAREIGHALEPYPDSLSSTPTQESLTRALQNAGYKSFDYHGDPNAETILVVLNGPFALTATSLVTGVSGLAVVVIRVLRPWDENSFSSLLPRTVKNVHVLEDAPFETALGVLHTDVLGSLVSSAAGGERPLPIVKSERIVPGRLQTFLDDHKALESFISEIVPQFNPRVTPASPSTKIIQFYSTPGTPLSSVPHIVEQTFIPTQKSLISSRLLTNYDLVTRSSGVALDRITLSKATSTVPLNGDRPADFVAVLDQGLLKTHTALEVAKPGAIILINTSWTAQELITNLPVETISFIRKRGLQICVLDVKKLVSGIHAPISEALEPVLAYIAFLRLYLIAATKSDITNLARTNLIVRAVENLKNVEIETLVDSVWDGLLRVVIPAEVPAPQNTPAPLKRFVFNAIATEVEGETHVNGTKLSSWHDAAKHILFPSIFSPPSELASSSEAYPQNPLLRPEIPDRTFLVTCTVNRRLTPLEYDRNVFHLEFDTSGTGLKYAIGEALGVHGWNDAQEVLDFCKWYGVNPDSLVTLPVPSSSSTEGYTRYHTRTVFQALQQQVDIFGKPTKSFYTDLAEFTTNKIDRLALLFIGSAEGSSTFKKMSEIDTVTFADVLKQFSSARPGIEVLCEIVGDIKPRHYSIASSQAVVGDRVDLLVVTVEWQTPSGSTQYGQCTRYLAELKPGQKVTVSIKPSVMKLPPDSRKPLILAGLGTGAAPFRAFLQHRAWEAAQGIPIGPIYYYFGSRHQSQEYLYGEEIEAFIDSGVITKAGLAFSRDGPKKVYIQHKMDEDGDTLARSLLESEGDGVGGGVFYLCGPTWPVPDVYEALVSALVRSGAGFNAVSAGEYLEGLKEEERYVLEVY